MRRPVFRIVYPMLTGSVCIVSTKRANAGAPRSECYDAIEPRVVPVSLRRNLGSLCHFRPFLHFRLNEGHLEK